MLDTQFVKSLSLETQFKILWTMKLELMELAESFGGCPTDFDLDNLVEYYRAYNKARDIWYDNYMLPERLLTLCDVLPVPTQ